MRVFTFISKQGDSLPLAQRVVDEGHRSVFYINDPKRRRIGNGLIEKSQVKERLVSESGSINESVLKQLLHPKPDCVIFDMVGWGFGKVADKLRRDGYAVLGGCQFGDQVELDRPYGNKIMKMYGINTPKTYTFNDYKMAIRFVEDTNQPYVYKPSGNQPTTTTYVAQKADDLIGMLEYYSGIKEEFELQEKVSGVEVSTELWFNGKEVLNVNHTMEEKSLMEDGIGPKTGSMGSVVWIGSKESRLFKEGVGKTIPALRKINYRGPIDLNTIVSKDKLYGLEFTARFGYDAIFTLREAYKGRVSDWFYSFAAGVANEFKTRPGWSIGVVFALEPYPLIEIPEHSKDILLQGFNQYNLKHTWFYDVYKKDDRLACAGNGGNLGVITARGDTVREAKRRAYRTISNLVIPDVIYRRDIGSRVDGEYAQLKEWKWI